MTTKHVSELDFRPSSEEEGGATVPFARIFGPQDFGSRFRWVDLCIVKPGAEIGAHRHLVDDEVYLILQGRAVKTVNGEARPVGVGDIVLLKAGGSHSLKNETDQEVHVLVIDVLAPQVGEQSFLLRNIDSHPVVTKQAHDGVGHIQVGYLFNEDELGPAWDFIEVVNILPDSSVGVHEHVGNEEIYFIVRGEGLLHDDGQEIPVTPGTTSLCRAGSRHGLFNTSAEMLTMVVAQTQVPVT